MGLLAAQQGLDHFVDADLVERPAVTSCSVCWPGKWIIRTGRGSKRPWLAASSSFVHIAVERHMGTRQEWSEQTMTVAFAAVAVPARVVSNSPSDLSASARLSM